ncbi:Dehydratase [Lachnellula willkommii]|uniref:Dehydratase n=1 Tax=Lachnellula willkommii TaxID=215461 RepID=A0A559MFQ2_9HELO|nr:Dehydratase [Lachnellula willkommii]
MAFHVDKTTSAVLAAQGLPVAEYDGEVNRWAASLEDIMAMYTDPEYQRLVLPDAEVFSKTKESKMMIGYDKDFVADGKVV